MNAVVYYVIQCGNNDIYDRSFILFLGKAFERPVKVFFFSFFYFLINLAQRWNAFFSLLNSSRRSSFYLSHRFQARRLSENNTPRQRCNQKEKKKKERAATRSDSGFAAVTVFSDI